MTKRERTIWDDLVEIGREVLEKLEDVINPDRKRRKPVRVPVPVTRDNPRDPYRQ